MLRSSGPLVVVSPSETETKSRRCIVFGGTAVGLFNIPLSPVTTVQPGMIDCRRIHSNKIGEDIFSRNLTPTLGVLQRSLHEKGNLFHAVFTVLAGADVHRAYIRFGVESRHNITMGLLKDTLGLAAQFFNRDTAIDEDTGHMLVVGTRRKRDAGAGQGGTRLTLSSII
jgi:hypothetical protein